MEPLVDCRVGSPVAKPFGSVLLDLRLIAISKSVSLPARNFQCIAGRKGLLELSVQLPVESLPFQFILGILRHVTLRMVTNARSFQLTMSRGPEINCEPSAHVASTVA